MKLHQLSVRPRDVPSAFCMATILFVNFRELLHLTSNFLRPMRPSVNFCRLFICPWDLPSTLHVSTGPSVNFPSGHRTFLQLLSTFLASVGPSVSFHQLSVHPRDLPLTFHASTGFSVNFPCGCGSFHKLLSTFCAAKVPSVNFPFSRGTIRQLSVHQGDLP